MTIEAKIIADSISPSGARITTFELKYPRVIHSELMTHRAFSRNASSSRAIPWGRMRQDVVDDPYVPIYWGKNQKGMQATEELPAIRKEQAEHCWIKARDEAVYWADHMDRVGVHKQVVNRLIEPFAHIRVVCTATSFANWFALRMHPDAMPEIQCLAVRMAEAYRDSEPRASFLGDWHLPYVTPEDRASGMCGRDLARISAARCARVSYRTHDGGTPSVDEDLALFSRLMESEPLHASPAEHQAFSAESANYPSGNFRGWIQHRKHYPNECAPPDFDWQARLIQYEGRDYVV